jgi:2'-5' RNA ligase
MARVRTFLAIEVDAAVRQAAAGLQRDLAKSGAAVKWVEPANLHVTLQFLGEVDDRELMTVCRAVAGATADIAPFAARFAGLGAFPNLRRPKTVWAAVSDGAAELRALFAALDGPLIETGCYRPEERPFAPHLTLGRVNADDDGQRIAAAIPGLQAWSAGPTAVAEVVVFGSELRRTGPEYTPLGRAALGG